MKFVSVNKLSTIHSYLDIILISFAVNILVTSISEPSVLLLLLGSMSLLCGIESNRYKSWWQEQLKTARNSSNPLLAREDIIELNKQKILITNLFTLVALLIVPLLYIVDMSDRHGKRRANELIINEIRENVSAQNKGLRESKEILHGISSKINDANKKVDSLQKDTKNLVIEIKKMQPRNLSKKKKFANR
jgi:hypothetical protein